MNSMTDLYRRRRAATSATNCEPAPVRCSTCGMLECLCRPRFFAGQVLTADDLNRLDAYVRGKNRLHNRQLHGWGVVNGLEVTCAPCGEGVNVSCGYALGPCGEDIVVCDAVRVDVCSLIKACKASEPRQHCDPYKPGAEQHPCEALQEEWVLAIRYSETPARGVKPLLPPSVDTGGCGCSGGGASGGCGCKGGSGSGSCGCKGGGAGSCGCGGSTPSASAKPRTAPAQCEPAVICEGYAFEVFRAPFPQNDDKRSDNGSEILRRFECCAGPLLKDVPQYPQNTPMDTPAGYQVWYQYTLQLRAFLLSHLASRPGYHCALIARLGTIVIPPPGTIVIGGGQTFDPAALEDALLLLVMVWIDALLACFCSALLPPCPEPSDDLRVPLAVLHVAADCRVNSICNWTTLRKFAATLPNLQYWLSALPFGRALREILESICCFDVTTLFGDKPQQPPPPPPPPAGAPAGTPTEPAPGMFRAEFRPGEIAAGNANLRLNPTFDTKGVKDMSELVAAATRRGRRPLDAKAFAASFLSRDGGRPGDLSAIEMARLPQFLALNQVARPIALGGLDPFAALLRDRVGALLGMFGGGGGQDDALRREFDELKRHVAAQDDEIRALRKQRKPDAPAKKGKR